jgi:hypothetical protein
VQERVSGEARCIAVRSSPVLSPVRQYRRGGTIGDMDNGTHSRAALAEELRGRLDRDLLAARKGRHQPEVNAIRGLKSALANAEAVPVAEGPL